MVKKKLYRYYGRNGFVTTFVFLDGVNHTPMYRLEADKNKLLTDGERYLSKIEVFAEDLDKWTEVNTPEEDKI